MKSLTPHQLNLKYNPVPALFDPFLSARYTSVRIFRSPKDARKQYLNFKLNLDFTGKTKLEWFDHGIHAYM